MSGDGAGAATSGKEERRELKPRLRFPGFVDSWHSPAMTEVYQFKGNNSLSRDQLNYESGSLRTIHYGDIHTKFSSGFRADDERVPFVNDGETHSSLREANWCSAGDMVFADASEDIEDIGKALEIVDAGSVPLTAGLHTILASPDFDRITGGFGRYLFASQVVRRQIQKQAQGAKVLGISPTRLGSIQIFLPSDTAEQRKIADCLSSLDAVIAAQGERLVALRKHKKGLLQALFPAEGQTAPRLRFPEFRDAGKWDNRTLAEVTDMRAGKFIPASDISGIRAEGSFPCFGGNGLRGYTSTYTHTGKYPLVGRQGARCGNVNLASGSFYATEHAVVAKARDGVSVDWLYHLLVRFDLNRFKTGQAQPGLSVEVINRLPCLVPSEIEEQQRIADCLSWLDELIVVGEQRLAILEIHKSGLMQRLFPASIEAVA